MGKKLASPSTNSSTSGTGLFGTLRNSFRRRSSSSSGKLNTASLKREPTSEAIPIVNQSRNGKVQPKSNYSNINNSNSLKNGVNSADSVAENPLKINYPDSDVTSALETGKLASGTAGTDCRESNLGEIKKHQEASKESKEEQTSVTDSNEINSPLPVLGAQDEEKNDLKKVDENDVSTDAEMFRFLSNGIYSNLAILSAMSRQGSVNESHLPQPRSLQTSESIYSNSSPMAPTYDTVSLESANAIHNNISTQSPPSISSCTPPASPLSSADQSVSSTTCPMSTSSLSLKSFSSSSESSQSSLKPSNPMMLLIKQHLQTKYPQYSIINQNDLQVLILIFKLILEI